MCCVTEERMAWVHSECSKLCICCEFNMGIQCALGLLQLHIRMISNIFVDRSLQHFTCNSPKQKLENLKYY